LLAAVLAFAVTVMFWPSTAESPIVAATVSPSPVVAPTTDVKDVRVEHELIRVTQRTTLPPQTRFRPVRTPAISAKAPEATAPEMKKPEGIAGRAARAFLGDGRNRPQPFPRPGQ
jgi:hypothetical protein